MGNPENLESSALKQVVLRSADLLALQSAVLVAVARGTPLRDTLELLCQHIEALAGEVRCSVLLLEGDRLRHGAAPSLPASYIQAIDNMQIGDGAGSCGTAAFRGEAVEVSDIEHDPYWADFKHLALPINLRACWSSPILGRNRRVLGTFALYYGCVRKPSAFHREAVQAATDLASIAIERHHMDEAERARVAELEQRVEARTQDLALRNHELEQTVGELQHTQEALIEARKLISLGRLVAGLAHELNTPIGNARLLSTSLLERSVELRARIEAGELKRSEMLRFLAAQEDGSRLLSQALAGAVERISSFRAIVVEHEDAQLTRFALHELVGDTVQLLSPLLREAQCEIVNAVPADILLDSYPAQLQQVLTNLFSNAIQHGFDARPGGLVKVMASRSADGHITLSVHDDGQGIAPAVLTRVFDPFFTTRMGQGFAGLGLHVAYTLVHGLLGGDIQVDSPPGEGTTVTLSLPQSAPAHSLAPR